MRRNNEVEDGMGFAGLIPSKEEKIIENLEQENKDLKQKNQKLVEALKNIKEGTSLGNSEVCSVIYQYAEQTLKEVGEG